MLRGHFKYYVDPIPLSFRLIRVLSVVITLDQWSPLGTGPDGPWLSKGSFPKSHDFDCVGVRFSVPTVDDHSLENFKLINHSSTPRGPNSEWDHTIIKRCPYEVCSYDNSMVSISHRSKMGDLCLGRQNNVTKRDRLDLHNPLPPREICLFSVCPKPGNNHWLFICVPICET